MVPPFGLSQSDDSRHGTSFAFGGTVGKENIAVAAGTKPGDMNIVFGYSCVKEHF